MTANYCQQCGHNITDDANFCPECGTHIRAHSEPVVDSTPTKDQVAVDNPGRNRTISFNTKAGREHVNIDNIGFYYTRTEWVSDLAITALKVAAGIFLLIGYLTLGIYGVGAMMVLLFLVAFYPLGNESVIGTVADTYVLSEPIPLLSYIGEHDTYSQTDSPKRRASEQELIENASELVTIENLNEDIGTRETYRYHFVPDNIVSITEWAAPNILGWIFIGLAFVSGALFFINVLGFNLLKIIFYLILVGICLFLLGYLGVDGGVKVTLHGTADKTFEMQPDDVDELIDAFETRGPDHTTVEGERE